MDLHAAGRRSESRSGAMRHRGADWSTLALVLAAVVLAGMALAQAATASGGSPRVMDLEVDGRSDQPLGVDDRSPTLSWRVHTEQDDWRQTGYQVRMATSERRLDRGQLLWDSGKVRSSQQANVRYGGPPLRSRQTVVWQVRVWGRGDGPERSSGWSRVGAWEMGLLARGDWGAARWIEHPARALDAPLPVFARAFELGRRDRVTRARLYLSGIGIHEARLNGRRVTDEVLAPGNSNYQLSVEYRTYDVSRLLQRGSNTLGVELGHGPALVLRSITNPATGRTAPYSWWQSQLKGSGTLAVPVQAGATNVKLSSVDNFHVGGTINIDTGDGGDRLESRTITSIGTAGADGTGISFDAALDAAHDTGASVTGSGNSLATTDPSAGAAVTPRMIARLELTNADGSTQTIVSDRSWKTALGPTVFDQWYSGTDYDARRELRDWRTSGVDLSDVAARRDGSPVGWTRAGIAPPPNLTTELNWRVAEPLEVVDRFRPVSVTEPRPGVWVFDLGQNFSGWPQLRVDGSVPAGTTIKLQPAESLNADGTVDQTSLMGGGGRRGTDLFATYTTHGSRTGETWHPQFGYFGMQWVQVTGLPEGYTPTADTISGLQIRATVPDAGDVETSNARINRLHGMARYSIMSNAMSVLTDCPGREKLAYPADYTQPFGSIASQLRLRRVPADDAAPPRRRPVEGLVQRRQRGVEGARVRLGLHRPLR